MHHTLKTRYGSLVILGVVALVVLLLWMADPAFAGPRAGITVARGVPAEGVSSLGSVAAVPELSSASLAAPLRSSAAYLTIPVAPAWAVGLLGAIVLIGGATAFALAERRGRGGRLAEPAGWETAAVTRRPRADDRRREEERRRRAA